MPGGVGKVVRPARGATVAGVDVLRPRAGLLVLENRTRGDWMFGAIVLSVGAVFTTLAVLEDQPTGMVAFGVAGMVAGLLVVAVRLAQVKVGRCSFDRDVGTVVIDLPGIEGPATLELADIVAVDVVRFESDDAVGGTYSVVARFRDDSEARIDALASSDRTRHEALAKTVAEFLELG